MKIYIVFEPNEQEKADEVARKIQDTVAPESYIKEVSNIPAGDETAEELRTANTRIRTPYMVIKV